MSSPVGTICLKHKTNAGLMNTDIPSYPLRLFISLALRMVLPAYCIQGSMCVFGIFTVFARA